MSAFHRLICGTVVITIVLTGHLLAQQQPPTGEPSPISDSSQATERQQILESRRWRNLEQLFHDWLTVQNIYSPEEIAQMKARLRQRIQEMSAPQLEDFMDDAEERLHLLLSGEATQARSWLSFFTPQARREMISPQGAPPDVFGMSVNQLRQELDQFQQQRSERAAAQSAFNRSRDQQVATVEQQRQAQRRAVAASERPAATFGPQPPAVPPRQRVVRYPSPNYWITPWGGVARGVY